MGGRSATTVNYERSTQQRIQQVEYLTNEVFNRTFQQVGYFKNNEVINREINKLVTSTRDNHRTNDWLSQTKQDKNNKKNFSVIFIQEISTRLFHITFHLSEKDKSNWHSKNFWPKTNLNTSFSFGNFSSHFCLTSNQKVRQKKKKRKGSLTSVGPSQ